MGEILNINGQLPDGTYDGLLGGYEIVIFHEGVKYILSIKDGVRTVDLPVIVTVFNGVGSFEILKTKSTNTLELSFSELRKGLKVKDSDGDIGEVKDCSDIHNVVIKFKDGLGVYCLDKNCYSEKEVYGGNVKIQNYTPLWNI